MTLRRTEEQEVRELLALRPTDDLTDDERRRVDEALLYSDECRNELAGYEACLAVLQAAAAEPLPTDARPSIWTSIEPRLGPARRFAPRRMFAAIPTYWLTAAVLLLAAGNVYLLTLGGRQNEPTRSLALADQPGAKAPLPSGIASTVGGVIPVANRFPVLVDPRDAKGRVRPLLGVFVVPCDGDEGGVEVQGIYDGTSAEEAGLEVGDILVEIDGRKIRDPGCLVGCLKHQSVGQRIDLVYLRDGRRCRTSVFLGGLVNMGDRQFLIKNSPIPPELFDQGLGTRDEGRGPKND